METWWRTCLRWILRSLDLSKSSLFSLLSACNWRCVSSPALATCCHASLHLRTLPPETIITNKLFQKLLLPMVFYHRNKRQIECDVWSLDCCELFGNMLGDIALWTRVPWGRLLFSQSSMETPCALVQILVCFQKRSGFIKALSACKPFSYCSDRNKEDSIS